MSQLPHGDVLSTVEVAQLMRVDARTVARKARSGTIPARKLPGRTGAYVFDRATIEQLIATDERVAS